MVARSFISLLLALALLGSVSSAKVLAQSQTTQPAPSIEGLIESMVNYHPYVLAINEGNYQAAAEESESRTDGTAPPVDARGHQEEEGLLLAAGDGARGLEGHRHEGRPVRRAVVDRSPPV